MVGKLLSLGKTWHALVSKAACVKQEYELEQCFSNAAVLANHG